MRYLAEIKRQSKGFMGGVETKLKLLAFQEGDRSWNISSGADLVSIEETNDLGEGALVMVTLDDKQQIKGSLEPASKRIIGILQSFSRLIEKSKSQEEEIETWKESLTIQSEELSSREMDMETRLEQLEQMEAEIQQFDQQRQEISSSREEINKLKTELEEKSQQLLQEREQLDQKQQNLEKNLKEGNILDPAQAGEIQNLLKTLSTEINLTDSSTQHLNSAKAKVKIVSLVSRLQKKRQLLKNKQTLLDSVIEQEESQTSVISRLDLLGIETAGSNTAQKINVHELENMSLTDLEDIVANLRKDLEKIAQFVKDQEEELSWQGKAVEEIQQKIEAANDFDRLALEQELADEKEAKKMLDKTLIGQRRSLKERHEFLLQHSRILKRRQGVFDLEEDSQQIDLEPIKAELQQQQDKLAQKRQEISEEMETIRQNINNLKSELQQKLEQENMSAELNIDQINLQDIISKIKQDLDLMAPDQNEDPNSAENPHQVLNKLDNMIKELVGV